MIRIYHPFQCKAPNHLKASVSFKAFLIGNRIIQRVVNARQTYGSVGIVKSLLNEGDI